MKLSQIKPNPNNPRLIKDDKFQKLVKSISEFPEMMEKRPIICVTDVDGKIYPLGGNMRLKALQELKYKEIPDSWVQMADEWTEEQRKEFVIKDNVGFGEWDWEQLANEWDSEKLEDWGLDLPDFGNDAELFTCQHCGDKKQIQAHHIIEWAKDESKRFVIDNGLTLCVKCHSKVHGRNIGHRSKKHLNTAM